MKSCTLSLALVCLFVLAGCSRQAPAPEKPSPAIAFEAQPDGVQLAALNSALPHIYTARTDDEILQPLSPAPDMGGLIGLNKVFTDARFGNARTLRATDDSTGKPGQIMFTADGGAPTLWASDSRHFTVHANGGLHRVVAFDPKTFTVANTPLAIPDDVVFSWRDPQMLFQLRGTILHQLTAAADWQTIASDQVLGDLRACLGADFKTTWSGTFTAKRDDQTFVVAFSNEGAQGSGHYLVGFRVGRGCSMLDSKAGTVGGQWGAKGPIDDGVNLLADRCLLHEGGGGQNEHYATFGCTLHQPNGTPGCVAGGCAVNNPYVWEVGTTHVRPCGGFKCDGHAADGYLYRATGHFFTLHSYAHPSGPLTRLLGKGQGLCSDMHGSWLNSTRNDLNPMMAVTTDTSPVSPYPCAGYDEVIGIATDGTGRRYRFGQTLNTGTSQYFTVANAIGVVDQSGRYMLFSSDWGGTIPGAVFIMELK